MALHTRIKFKSRSRSSDRFHAETREDLESSGLYRNTDNACETILSGAMNATELWQKNSGESLGEIEPDIEGTYFRFGRAAMSADGPAKWQRLVATLDQIRELGTVSRTKDKQEETAQMAEGRLWTDLPGFEPMLHQVLQAAFQAQFSERTAELYWTNLNNVLVRVSVAGVYDLRKCCLWVMRDVLEDLVEVSIDMLEVVETWLHAYAFWIERLVLYDRIKPQKKDEIKFFDPKADSTVLTPGNLVKNNEILADIDESRCLFWRRRLEEVGRASGEHQAAVERIKRMLPDVEKHDE